MNVGFLDLAEPPHAEPRHDFDPEEAFGLARPDRSDFPFYILFEERRGYGLDTVGWRLRGLPRLAPGSLDGRRVLPRRDVPYGFLGPPSRRREIDRGIGTNSQFLRRPIDAVADRPRARAGRLEHEIEARDLPVWNFAPRRRRLQVFDRNMGERLRHDRLPRLVGGNGKAALASVTPRYNDVERCSKMSRKIGA